MECFLGKTICLTIYIHGAFYFFERIDEEILEVGKYTTLLE